MATYFLDSSAVVKRYFPEKGHRWVVALCDAAQGHELYIAQSALVAGDLCRSYRLRAYDAVQLACTLAVREYTLAHQVSSELIFVSADVGLLGIANAVGLWVENPNTYI